MRTDMLPTITENEPHGFICKCGGVIHFGDEELTPPVTDVTCGFCRSTGQYLGDYADPALRLRHSFVKAKNLIDSTLTRDEIREIIKSLTEEDNTNE